MLSWLLDPQIRYDHKMEEAWDQIEWISNTLIFILGGFIAGSPTYDITVTPHIFGNILVLYIVATLGRALMVWIAYPSIRLLGEMMTSHCNSFI